MNKIKERRKQGAVCEICRSPDYQFTGRANSEEGGYWEENGALEFKCNSCGHTWQYGRKKENNLFYGLI